MSKSGPPVFISTSTTIVEIDMIHRNFVHFGKKINEKVTGDAQDNHHVVMESLDVLSSYVARAQFELVCIVCENQEAW
jgi:hypothetical protein